MKKVALYIQDLIKGTKIVPTMEFLLEHDFMTRDELDRYKFDKLKSLVLYSYQHVPYYRELFDSVNLKPEDIRSLADIEKIPVSTKEMIRQCPEKLLSDQFNVNSKFIIKGKTGGTTGMPLLLFKNAQTRSFTWGSYYRWYKWMGVSPCDKEVVVWGASSVLGENYFKDIKHKFVDKLYNRLTINSFGLSESTLPEIAERIIKFQPVLLRGYLSAILKLAEYFEKNNLTLPTLKAVSTTTETLLPIYRKYIEKVFNVEMFDQYGCGECNAIAYECSAHDGLHITEEHCLVEVLDVNNNSVQEKEGFVVVTDLDNYAMPFIRYENGDEAILTNKECGCGRHSSRLLSVLGRLKDVIYLNDGSSVHGVFFTDIFHELGFDNFKYFTRFQIYQQKKGSFVCRLEKTGVELPQDKLLLIQQTLERYADDVKIELCDHLLSDSSGKFRYIVSDLI